MNKKMLLELADNLQAEDITYLDFEKSKDLYNKIDKKDVAISRGVYGVNGYIFQDTKTSQFYVIKSRTSTLFQFL